MAKVTLSPDDTQHPWFKRWAVAIICRDCGESYECSNVSPSEQLVGGFNRVFLAGGPEVCPACKNLKVIIDG